MGRGRIGLRTGVPRHYPCNAATVKRGGGGRPPISANISCLH